MDEQKREAQVPVYLLTDPRFEWVPSGQTDVTRIWRKYGWTPPSENKRERKDRKSTRLNSSHT